MAKKRKTNKTRHHVIPLARSRQRIENNIVVLSRKKHQAYHLLFGVLTPDEIIKELVENYWHGKWHYLNEALNWREYK